MDPHEAPTHAFSRVGNEARQGRAHAPRDRRHLGDRDRGYPRLAETSLKQPDRLLADRPGRDEQGEVDLLGTQPIDRRRNQPFEDVPARGTYPIVETTVGASDPMNPASARARSVRTGNTTSGSFAARSMS